MSINSKRSKVLPVLYVLGGIFLFILIAPLLILAAWLLVWGVVAIAVIGFMAYVLYELWQGR